MRVVLQLDGFVSDSYYFERVVELPFAPMPGLGLMLGPSAWWQQVTIWDVRWFVDQKEFRCGVVIDDTGGNSLEDIESALTSSGWSPS